MSGRGSSAYALLEGVYYRCSPDRIPDLVSRGAVRVPWSNPELKRVMARRSSRWVSVPNMRWAQRLHVVED